MKKLFLLFSFVLASAALFAEGPYKAGDSVSDFSLKNVNGQDVSLSSIEGAKGYIVIFSSNVCPMVKKYEDRIIALHKDFEPKGFHVVAINSNDKYAAPGDSYEDMKKLSKEKDYKFEYLYDETQEVAKRFGATNTPHVYLLSNQMGNLKVEYIGAIDNNPDNPKAADKKYVADAIGKLLKGEEPSVRSTRAIGCSIKWRKSYLSELFGYKKEGGC